MGLFITRDRKHYQRWINMLPSFLVPGVSQFLSGRKRTGLCWFLFFFALEMLAYGIILHPAWVVKKFVFIAAASGILALWLIMVADAFRTPIPRMGFKGWVWVIAVTLLLSTPDWLVDRYVITTLHQPTGSMFPTLTGFRETEEGNVLPCDQLFVNKLIYRLREPRRGEVVIFNTTGLKHPLIKKDALYCKRVVGLPGEIVTLVPPHVYINGEKLLAPPIFKEISSGEDGYRGFQFASSNMLIPSALSKATDRVELKENEYFVLGDNTVSSLDGRHHGPIMRDKIIGKVTKVFQPFDRVKVVE